MKLTFREGGEGLLHDLDQLLHAFVNHSGIGADESREISCKAEDVPWVDERSAFDTALDQIEDLIRYITCLVELASAKQLVSNGQQAIDSAKDSGGRHLHNRRLHL